LARVRLTRPDPVDRRAGRGDGLDGLVTAVAARCASIVEMLGVGTITVTALYALLRAAILLRKRETEGEIFQQLRQLLGRGVLLGLEFLIAADIIYTVAVELTFETIGVLASVVLVRTFLSFTLEVELQGRWPWQAGCGSGD